MAEGGFLPWSIIWVPPLGHSPDDNADVGGGLPNDMRAALEDPHFMIAAGFSGPIYRQNPDTLNKDLDREVWARVRERLGSGELRFAVKRIPTKDWLAFVGRDNKVVGEIVEYWTGDDSAFWTMVNIAKSIVTAGVATAAEAAFASASVAESAASSTVEGATMFDGFDFDYGFATGEVDYGSVFESFDYTSGEGFSIFSDAQNVDYGFGAGFGDFDTGLDWANGITDQAGYNFDIGYDFGGTLESGVSDFGTWFNNSALDPVTDAVGRQLASRAVSSVLGQPRPAPTMNQTPITTRGILDGVQNLAGAAMQLIQVRDAYSSTGPQREGQQPRNYAGQLAPRPQSVGGVSQSPNWLLIGGAVLVAGGAIWYLRKGS